MYILKTEDGFYLSNENLFNHTRLVSEIDGATVFSYNDAVNMSNIYYQLSGVKTTLVKQGYESNYTKNYKSEY